jgi:hypothetical protein
LKIKTGDISGSYQLTTSSAPTAIALQGSGFSASGFFTPSTAHDRLLGRPLLAGRALASRQTDPVAFRRATVTRARQLHGVAAIVCRCRRSVTGKRRGSPDTYKLGYTRV